MKDALRLSVCTLLISLFALPAAAQQGRAVFEETRHDFETIQEGEQVRHVFTFRNEGDAPLRLTSVQPSCGCTTPKWTREAVAPSKTGTITAIFDSENRPGSFHKSIRVQTDGQPAETTLHIEGKVTYPDIEGGAAQGQMVLDRETINLGTIPPNERLQATFRFQNVGERPIRIGRVETPGNMVSAYVPEEPLFMDEVTEGRVAVRTYGMEAGQTFDYTLTLHTDDEAQPKKKLRVRGTVGSAPAQ